MLGAPGRERRAQLGVGRDAAGQRERAVMIHRVLFGSLERFVGGLIEHYAGNFPLWLSWEQVTVIPIREGAFDYGRSVADALRARGFRVRLERQGDMRNPLKVRFDEQYGFGVKLVVNQVTLYPFTGAIGQFEFGVGVGNDRTSAVLVENDSDGDYESPLIS